MKDPKIVWTVKVSTPQEVYGEVYKHKWIALVVSAILLKKNDIVVVRREWIDP